jgi:hypothetical protein
LADALRLMDVDAAELPLRLMDVDAAELPAISGGFRPHPVQTATTVTELVRRLACGGGFSERSALTSFTRTRCEPD